MKITKNFCLVAVTASAFLLSLTLQTPGAQAQQFVPAPNGDNNHKWVRVDDQFVPAGAVLGSKVRSDIRPLSLDANARKWPGGRVPYTFDATLTPEKQAVFLQSCREWEKHANLKFFPRTTEANYIVVKQTVNDSNSYIGMTGGGQTLNLAGWANKITSVHELAHALGIIHEQSRPDRDTYVTIHPENITDGLGFNFDKVGGALNQGPYDFDSMMHYYGTAFSKNGQPTITANAGYTQFQNKMGQQDHVSDGDKAGMALVYGKPGDNPFGALSPAFPKTKETLTAKPSGKGTPDQYSYVWKKNDVVIAGQTTNKLDLSIAGQGDKGDRIKVEISGPDADGVAGTEVAAVTVVNSAPVVATPPAPFTTSNTHQLKDQLVATDDDGDATTFLVVTNATKGALTLNADGSFVYNPAIDYFGADGFKAAANDGEAVSAPTTIGINIVEENIAPVLSDTALSAVIGTPFSAKLVATDANVNDTLSFSRTSGRLPNGLFLFSNGLISGTPTTVQKTEATVTVIDGKGGSATAKLNIEVTERAPSVTVTLAPLAPKTADTLTATAVISDPTSTPVTTVYNFLVNGKSVQSGPSNTLNMSVSGQGDKGDVVSCEVSATNAGGGKGVAVAAVTVVNSQPFARSGTGRVDADVVKAFELGGFDLDNETLKINIVDAPTNGTAEIRADADGRMKLFYRSRPTFNGTEVIRFTVSDSALTSTNIATFAIAVSYKAPVVNRAPVAGNSTLNAYIGQAATKALLGSDPDGDALTFRVVNNALYGKGEIKRDEDGVWKLFYTSLNRLYGSDRVTYVAIDSKGKESNVAKIEINFINRAPVAQSGSISVISGAPVSQYLFATDSDNDAITFRMINNPRYGKSEIKRDEQGAWRVYYQSVRNYVGPDRLTFMAIDAAGKQSAPATIEINVVRGAETPSAPKAARNGDAGSGGNS